MGEFGDKFRKTREAKELSLDEVSKVIKISPRMLQAIEEENFDRLPGGVFNKGFIRAYAKHLGLNPEEAITEYLDCLREAQVKAQQTWEPAQPEPGRSASPSKSPEVISNKPASVAMAGKTVTTAPSRSAANHHQQPAQVEELPDLQLPREEDVRPARTAFTQPTSSPVPWKLVAVAIVILFLGIILWTRRSGTTPTSHASSNTPVTNASTTPPPAVPPSVTPAPVIPTQTAANTPPVSSPTTTMAATAQSNTSGPSPKPVVPDIGNQSSGVAPQNAGLEEKAGTEEKNDVTIRTFGTAAPPPQTAENPSASFTLVIRAAENSWLSVIADGQQVRQETLIAPAHTTIHASREIIVKVGNAAGVSFLLNGAEISPQGNEAEPKTLVFNSTGLKTPGAQP